MGIDRDDYIAGRRPRVREVFSPGIRAKPQEILGERGFLPGLEVGEGLQTVHVLSVEQERVSLSCYAIDPFAWSGTHGREF